MRLLVTNGIGRLMFGKIAMNLFSVTKILKGVEA
jgi:hypothetical protein